MSCDCLKFAIYNPSTLKLQYNSVTNKAIYFGGIGDPDYTLDVSGIRLCLDDSLWAGNGVQHLTYSGITEGKCDWGGVGTYQLFLDKYPTISDPGHIRIIDGGGRYYFRADIGACDIKGIIANEIEIGDCGGSLIGYGGSVRWCMYWNPEGC